jgi:hypothetical protein
MAKDSCGCEKPGGGNSGGDNLACPVCAGPGEIVPGATVRKLLKPGLTAPWDRYLICKTASCDAVYYHPKGNLFKQADVTVPVYFKNGADPVHACYCAGVTRGQVEAAVAKTRATRWAVIIKEINGSVPKCRCEETNPLGKCCSANAYAAAIAGCGVKAAPVKASADPLHGVTLEAILMRLVKRHGWRGLGQRIPVRCFMYDPTVKSSLVFLRQTPWARKELEDWYLRELK